MISRYDSRDKLGMFIIGTLIAAVAVVSCLESKVDASSQKIQGTTSSRRGTVVEKVGSVPEVDYDAQLSEAFKVAAGTDGNPKDFTRKEYSDLIRGLGFSLVVHDDHDYSLSITGSDFEHKKVMLTDHTMGVDFSREASSVSDYVKNHPLKWMACSGSWTPRELSLLSSELN